jgi:hypothetical protein
VTPRSGNIPDAEHAGFGRVAAPMLRAAVAFVLALAAVAQAHGTQDHAELIAKLAAATSLDEQVLGLRETSENYKTFARLQAVATEAEWRTLTAHKAGVVRGYAVRALRMMEAKVDWQQLVIDHLADAETITVCEDCSRFEQCVGDAIFHSVESLLRPEQVLAIGTAAVQQKSPLYVREWALRNLTFPDAMLHPLRALAKAGDPPAAIALARYGIASDVPILITHLQRDSTSKAFDENCQFLAAAVSRDPRLLPALTALADAARKRLEGDNAYRLRFWVAALLAQDTPAAATFLRGFLDGPLPRRADVAQTVSNELVAVSAGATFDAVRQLANRLAAAK